MLTTTPAIIAFILYIALGITVTAAFWRTYSTASKILIVPSALIAYPHMFFQMHIPFLIFTIIEVPLAFIAARGKYSPAIHAVAMTITFCWIGVVYYIIYSLNQLT